MVAVAAYLATIPHDCGLICSKSMPLATKSPKVIYGETTFYSRKDRTVCLAWEDEDFYRYKALLLLADDFVDQVYRISTTPLHLLATNALLYSPSCMPIHIKYNEKERSRVHRICPGARLAKVGALHTESMNTRRQNNHHD